MEFSTLNKCIFFADNLVIDPVRMNRLEETTTIIESISSQFSDETNLVQKQQKAIAIFMQQVLGTRSLEEMAAVEKIMAPLAPTIDAIRTTKANYSLPSTSNTPSNKKIDPQRRLFTTIKKRKAQVLPIASSEGQDHFRL